jgi:hypothetical protein
VRFDPVGALRVIVVRWAAVRWAAVRCGGNLQPALANAFKDSAQPDQDLPAAPFFHCAGRGD